MEMETVSWERVGLDEIYDKVLLLWESNVPQIIRLDPTTDIQSLLYPFIPLNRIRRNLLEPLQTLFTQNILQSTEQKSVVARTDVASGTCARVFKIGEPTYSCRDCGADPTCVLCAVCFNESEHRNHRYKMSSSGGGGYCDCGDPEAWKTEPACRVHIRFEEGKSGLGTLDDSTATRFELFLQAFFFHVLRYTDSMANNGIKGEEDSDFAVLLYNDEIHTLDNIIRSLSRTLDIEHRVAEEIARRVEGDGRAMIRIADFEECRRTYESMVAQTSRNGQRAVKVEIRRTCFVAQQLFLPVLLDWVRDILNLSSAYRSVFYRAIMETGKDFETYLRRILLYDQRRWKAIREDIQLLLITGLLKDYSIKKAFTSVYGDVYGELMENFGYDEQEQSYSVTSLAVQILTVPSLAKFLIAQKDFFFNAMRVVLSVLEPRTWETEPMDTTAAGRRLSATLQDLKYLLTQQPKEWTPELKRGFTDGVYALIKLVGFLQESEPIRYQTGEHIQFDPAWEPTFGTHGKLGSVISLVVNWAATDLATAEKIYRRTWSEIVSLSEKRMIRKERLNVGTFSGPILLYDITKEPVSIYLPLTRLHMSLKLLLLSHGLSVSPPQTLSFPAQTPLLLMEAPLRTLTLLAQRHVGMWKRNGHSLLNQLHFYHNVRFRSDMFDKDLLMLQWSATELGPKDFLLQLINRFNILPWTAPTFGESSHSGEEQEEEVRYISLLMEEYLLLVMQVVSGRWVEGVGEVNAEEILRKEVLQLLSLGNTQHSKLNQALVEDIYGETGLEKVLREIATLKDTPKGTTYELKPEYYSDYDMFYYHYTRENMSKGEESQREKRGETDPLPPPKLPSLTAPFRSLRDILKEDLLLFLLEIILLRSHREGDRNYSQGQLRKALHLLAYGLNEEEQDPSFGFTAAAQKRDIFGLLHKIIQRPSPPHKEMLLYLVQKRKALAHPKDRLSSLHTHIASTETEANRVRKEKAAAAKARSLARISSLQEKFKTMNAELFVEEESGGGREVTEREDEREREKETEVLTCILCMEKEELSPNSRPFVVGAHIQPSSLLYINQPLHNTKLTTGFPPLPPPCFQGSPYIDSCGHVMHETCHHNHRESILARERRRPYRLYLQYDPETETICPMCGSLQNLLLPVLPPIPVSRNKQHLLLPYNMTNWLDILRHAIPVEDLHSDDIEVVMESKEGEELDFSLQLGEAYELFKTLWPSVQDSQEFPLKQPYLTRLDDCLRIISQTRKHNIHPYEMQEIWDARVSCIWETVAMTIASVEVSGREQGIPFFGLDVPSRQELSLKYLVRLGAVAIYSQPLSVATAEGIGQALIRMILEDPNGSYRTSHSLIYIDTFALFVYATYALNFLFLKQRKNEHVVATHGTLLTVYIFRTVFLFHMVQCLLEISPLNSNSSSHDPVTKEFESTCRELWEVGSIEREELELNWREVLEELSRKVLPFVSCAAKFYECLTGVKMEGLTETEEPLHHMLQYLSQPINLQDYFSSPQLNSTATTWLRANLERRLPYSPPIYPRSLPKLTPLPQDYIDLINSVADFACPPNKSLALQSRYPTLCLLCGKVLCSNSLCCQGEGGVGACSEHILTCGQGTGLFLRIRDSDAFILAPNGRGTYVPPPYVDEYGETDQGLRRGNPMKLSTENYNYLRKLWINHKLPEEVFRVNEKNVQQPPFLFTDWPRL